MLAMTVIAVTARLRHTWVCESSCNTYRTRLKLRDAWAGVYKRFQKLLRIYFFTLSISLFLPLIKFLPTSHHGCVLESTVKKLHCGGGMSVRLKTIHIPTQQPWNGLKSQLVFHVCR